MNILAIYIDGPFEGSWDELCGTEEVVKPVTMPGIEDINKAIKEERTEDLVKTIKTVRYCPCYVSVDRKVALYSMRGESFDILGLLDMLRKVKPNWTEALDKTREIHY